MGASISGAALSIAVISTVYGDYDEINTPVKQTIDADWIMVTDKEVECSPWNIIVEPRPHLPPRMAGKVAKACPELYSDAEIIIYIDANIQVHNPDFINWCLRCLGDNVLAAHHREMCNVQMEAYLANQLEKYRDQNVLGQADYYESQGSNGLVWGANFMIRHKDCPQFGPAWLTEMMRWSAEDQISLPYVLGKYGIRPNIIPCISYPVGEYIAFNINPQRWERRPELTQGMWWRETTH